VPTGRQTEMRYGQWFQAIFPVFINFWFLGGVEIFFPYAGRYSATMNAPFFVFFGAMGANQLIRFQCVVFFMSAA
jgi:hypothetical protein